MILNCFRDKFQFELSSSRCTVVCLSQNTVSKAILVLPAPVGHKSVGSCSPDLEAVEVDL